MTQESARMSPAGARRLLTEALPATLFAQVGFARQKEIGNPAAAERIRNSLGVDYPVLGMSQVRNPVPADEGLPPRNELYDVFWHLSEEDRDSTCRVALGSEGLSVAARRPKDRASLFDRLGSVVTKVQERFSPASSNWVGMRLVCEVDEMDVEDLVSPEFIGVHSQLGARPPFQDMDEGSARSEATFLMRDGMVVRARWGQRATGGFERGSVSELSVGGSWTMDLSLESDEARAFDADVLCKAVEAVAGRLTEFAVRFASDALKEEIEVAALPEEIGSDSEGGGSDDPAEKLKRELTTGQAVFEIKLLSGLSTGELAELFGVSRQSIHNWDCEGRMTRKNEDLLFRILAAVRHLYQDGNVMTYQLLTEVDEATGKTRFDLLKERRFDEAVAGVEDRDNLPDHSETRDEPEIHIPIDVQLGGSISDSTQFPGDVRPLEERSEAELRRINQLHPKSE